MAANIAGEIVSAGFNYTLITGNGNHVNVTDRQKINPVYENGTKYTPEQRRTILAVSLIAGMILLAAAAIAIGLLICAPIAFIAIPLVAGAIATTIWYLLSRKTDLDHPATRAGVINDLAHQSFKQIRDQYPIDDIVGYDLLATSCAEINKKEFYDRISALDCQLVNLTTQRDSHLVQINTLFNATIAPYEIRRDQGISNLRFNESMHRLGNAPLTHSRNRPLRAIGHINNAVVGIHTDLAVSDWNSWYSQMTAQPVHWRNQQLAYVNNAFSRAISLIDSQFASLKTTFA